VAVLVGWDVWATIFLVRVWTTIWTMDAASTAQHALEEDDSRAAAEAVLVGAGVASLLGVAFTLAEAGNANEPATGLLTGLAVASVMIAWAAIHTVYVLRYARLYYSAPVGGIDFNEDDPPDYRDLGYVALTIGMTYQISDTDLTSKRMRRTAIHHALLSFLFGTVILAVTVSTVASILGS
jgi:uncharacterized membrane protein